MARKTLQDLTIKDNFLFAAVLMDPTNCKAVLERILEFEIDHVEVSNEKNIMYNPEFHGIRLDVYAKDDDGTHYDVEIQVIREDVFKRSRYYHSQMDMELLLSGKSYEELPDGYVIFICDFDPVGLRKYRYTVKSSFYEDETYNYDDGAHTYFLSTKGENDSEVPEQLVKFLKFVGASLSESMDDYDDNLISSLQTSIRQIKDNREMGNRYMLFEELLKNEFKEGRNEGKAEGLIEGKAEGLIEGKAEGLIEGKAEGLIEGKAEGLIEGKAEGLIQGKIEVLQSSTLLVLNLKQQTIPEDTASKIHSIKDLKSLEELLSFAASAASLEDFVTLLDDKITKNAP